MPRRIHKDLTTSDDADSRARGIRVSKPSNKAVLADLAPAAVLVARFTERDKQILKAWLTAQGDVSIAAFAADCSDKQIWNVLRKLRQQLSKLEKNQIGHLPLRIDKRKSRRILERSIFTRVDQELLRDFKANPLQTAVDYVARKKAAQASELRGPRNQISDSPGE